MSLLFSGGNQSRAARIAHEIVRELAPSDVECTISELMSLEENDRLCSAVSKDYLGKEKRLILLHDKIREGSSDEIQEMFREHSDLELDVATTKAMAAFNLGFAAALRLLGAPPSLGLLQGGNREPRLKGNSSL